MEHAQIFLKPHQHNHNQIQQFYLLEDAAFEEVAVVIVIH